MFFAFQEILSCSLHFRDSIPVQTICKSGKYPFKSTVNLLLLLSSSFICLLPGIFTRSSLSKKLPNPSLLCLWVLRH